MSSALQVIGLPGKRRTITAKTPVGSLGRSAFDRVFGGHAVEPFFREMGRAVWYESKLDGAGTMHPFVGPVAGSWTPPPATGPTNGCGR